MVELGSAGQAGGSSGWKEGCVCVGGDAHCALSLQRRSWLLVAHAYGSRTWGFGETTATPIMGKGVSQIKWCYGGKVVPW